MQTPSPTNRGVARIELVLVRLPLRAPFVSAHGVETVREVSIVRVVGQDGTEGWGECSSLSTPGYATECSGDSWRVLCEQIAPALLAGDDWRDTSRPMASAAVETALVDLECRARHESLSRHLGGTRSVVEACAVIGITQTVDELLAATARIVEDGYRHLKLKIRPGWDLVPLRAVRDAFPQVTLAADANGSYDRIEAFPATGIDALSIAYVEQPFPPGRMDLAVALGGVAETPVALDESIGSPDAARRAIAIGAAGVINVKPARVGGIGEACRICAIAADAGVPTFVGGMLETGVGRAAALAVASLPACSLPTDLGPSRRYFERDLTEPIELRGGSIPVPGGEGIGVVPVPERLDALAVERRVLG